ncbi:hypothetical protein CY34DRAFT_806766, partial [Suillus luteus UH-Slu-Lm8-n1]
MQEENPMENAPFAMSTCKIRNIGVSTLYLSHRRNQAALQRLYNIPTSNPSSRLLLHMMKWLASANVFGFACAVRPSLLHISDARSLQHHAVRYLLTCPLTIQHVRSASL